MIKTSRFLKDESGVTAIEYGLIASGIGMAIIKKLVEWRGGSCWITDGADGRGACINFLWPKTWA